MTANIEKPQGGERRQVLSIAPIRLLVMFGMFVGVYSAMATGAYRLYHTLSAGWRELAVIVAALIIVIVLLRWYRQLVKWFEGRQPTELSLNPGVSLLLVGTLIGFACLSLVFAFYWLRGMLGSAQFVATPAVIATLVICVIASLAEELLMRGIVFRVLEQWLGSAAAIGFSALMFGLIHLFNPNATWIGALAIAAETGLLLGGAFMLYRNLWLAIGVYFGWNVAETLIYGANDSGLALRGLFHVPVQGTTLLTGGEFGPEASLPAMVAGTLFGVFMVVLAARRGQWRPLHWQLRLPRGEAPQGSG